MSCICYAAFEALQNPGLPYCFYQSLNLSFSKLQKSKPLRSPLSKVSKSFLHPEELKLKEVLYFNVGF